MRSTSWVLATRSHIKSVRMAGVAARDELGVGGCMASNPKLRRECAPSSLGVQIGRHARDCRRTRGAAVGGPAECRARSLSRSVVGRHDPHPVGFLEGDARLRRSRERVPADSPTLQQSEDAMKWIAWLAAGVAALYVLHRLALWAEQRGWIYYQRKRSRTSLLGTGIQELHALLEPSRQHVIEARQQDREQDEAGDPPTSPDASSR
jgi:hypothetical protein